MATPDDVNAQHLASMGVEQGDLGQPYATTEAGPSKDNEGRCKSTNAGQFRCARTDGHPGYHARGLSTWEYEGGSDWVDDGESVDQFTYTFWGEVPWVEGCERCRVLKAGPENVPALINHMAQHPVKQPTKTREGDQVLPTPGQQCVQDLVIAEMQESKRVGLERYGSTLQTFNGRRSIQDVAEEVRDLHVYLTQVKAESETDRKTLISVVGEALMKDEAQSEAAYGRLPIVEFAETAVDAIMGWVVGQTMGRFTSQGDLYRFLDDAHPGRHYSDAQILECLTHALGDRLSIPSEES